MNKIKCNLMQYLSAQVSKVNSVVVSSNPLHYHSIISSYAAKINSWQLFAEQWFHFEDSFSAALLIQGLLEG
jgi:hypothetical protein